MRRVHGIAVESGSSIGSGSLRVGRLRLVASLTIRGISIREMCPWNGNNSSAVISPGLGRPSPRDVRRTKRGAASLQRESHCSPDHSLSVVQLCRNELNPLHAVCAMRSR